MEAEQLAIKLQQTDDRSLRNEGRIKKLEAENDVLHQLATSVAVMAEQLQNMTKSMDNLSDKVDELEKKPGKRWDSISEKVIWAVVAAVVAFVLGRVGL